MAGYFDVSTGGLSRLAGDVHDVRAAIAAIQPERELREAAHAVPGSRLAGACGQASHAWAREMGHLDEQLRTVGDLVTRSAGTYDTTEHDNTARFGGP